MPSPSEILAAVAQENAAQAQSVKELELQRISARKNAELAATQVTPQTFQNAATFQRSGRGAEETAGLSSASEVEADLYQMDAEQLRIKYGAYADKLLAERQVALNQQETQDRIYNAGQANRVDAERGYDAVVSGVKGAAQMGLGLANLGYVGVDAALGTDYSVDSAAFSQWASQGLGNLRTDNLQQGIKKSNALSALNARDNDQKMQEDLAAGNSDLVAAAARIGRGFGSEVGRIAESPDRMFEIGAEGLGSLGGMSYLAKGAASVGTATSGALQANKLLSAAGAKVLEKGGNALKIPLVSSAVMGGTASEQAINQAMQVSDEQMLNDPKLGERFSALVQEHGWEQARRIIASETGQLAAPGGMALGFATGFMNRGFDSAPMARHGLGTAALNTFVKEPLQETIEEGGEAGIANRAVKMRADSSQSLSANVGENAAAGAFGATLASGAVSSVTTIPAQLEATGKVLKYSSKLLGKGVAAAVKPLGSAISQASDKKVNADNPVSDEVVAKAASVAVTPEVTEVVNAVVEAVAANPEATVEQKAAAEYATKLRDNLGWKPEPVEELEGQPQAVIDLLSSPEPKSKIEILQGLSRISKDENQTEDDRAGAAVLAFIYINETLETLVEGGKDIDVEAVPELKDYLKSYDQLGRSVLNSPLLGDYAKNASELLEFSERLGMIRPINVDNLADPTEQANLDKIATLALSSDGKNISPELSDSINNAILSGAIELDSKQGKSLNLLSNILKDNADSKADALAMGLSEEVVDVNSEIFDRSLDNSTHRFSVSSLRDAVVAAHRNGDVQAAQEHIATLRNLALHFSNKVDALNKHIIALSTDSKAPPQKFMALSLRQPGVWRKDAGKVAYQYSNPEFARKVTAEARMLMRAANTLNSSFGDGSLKPLKNLPTLNEQAIGSVANRSSKTPPSSPEPSNQENGNLDLKNTSNEVDDIDALIAQAVATEKKNQAGNDVPAKAPVSKTARQAMVTARDAVMKQVVEGVLKTTLKGKMKLPDLAKYFTDAKDKIPADVKEAFEAARKLPGYAHAVGNSAVLKAAEDAYVSITGSNAVTPLKAADPLPNAPTESDALPTDVATENTTASMAETAETVETAEVEAAPLEAPAKKVRKRRVSKKVEEPNAGIEADTNTDEVTTPEMLKAPEPEAPSKKEAVNKVEEPVDEADVTTSENDVVDAIEEPAEVAPSNDAETNITVPMNYQDGQDTAHKMRKEFKGKSTMDLILSGDRTATTGTLSRFKGLTKGSIFTVENKKTGQKARVRATTDPYLVSEITGEEWSQLEGWDSSLYDKYKGRAVYQMQYELVDKPKIPATGSTKKEGYAQLLNGKQNRFVRAFKIGQSALIDLVRAGNNSLRKAFASPEALAKASGLDKPDHRHEALKGKVGAEYVNLLTATYNKVVEQGAVEMRALTSASKLGITGKTKPTVLLTMLYNHLANKQDGTYSAAFETILGEMFDLQQKGQEGAVRYADWTADYQRVMIEELNYARQRELVKDTYANWRSKEETAQKAIQDGAEDGVLNEDEQAAFDAHQKVVELLAEELRKTLTELVPAKSRNAAERKQQENIRTFVGKQLPDTLRGYLAAKDAKGVENYKRIHPVNMLFLKGMDKTNNGRLLNLATWNNEKKQLELLPEVNTAIAAAVVETGLNLTTTQRNYAPTDRQIASALGIKEAQVTESLRLDFKAGTTSAAMLDALSSKITEFMAIRGRADAFIGDAQGIPLALAGLALSAATAGTDKAPALIQMHQLKVSEDSSARKLNMYTATKRVEDSPAKKAPRLLSLLVDKTGSNDVFVLGREQEIPVDKNVLHSPMQPLTKSQQQAVGEMQKAESFLVTPVMKLYDTLGEGLLDVFGENEDPELNNINTLEKNKGINLSIAKALEKLETVRSAVANYAEDQDVLESEVPLRFKNSVTSVGRFMQVDSFNGQANKFMRAVVSPTIETYDLTDKETKDGFIKAIAQSIGIKVHNLDPSSLAAEVEKVMSSPEVLKLREHLDAIENDVLGEDGTSIDAVLDDIIDALPKFDSTVRGLVAVLDYTRMVADPNNTEFEASTAIEADGVNNGMAGAKMTTSFGAVDAAEIKRWRMFGFFVNEHVDGLFTQRLKDATDMYSEIGNTAAEYIKSTVVDFLDTFKDKSVKTKKEIYRTKAAESVNALIPAMKFLGLKIKVDSTTGSIEIKRSFTKNPSTIITYGAGDAGIGANLANEMLDSIYDLMSEHLANPTEDSKYSRNYKVLDASMRKLGVIWRVTVSQTGETKLSAYAGSKLTLQGLPPPNNLSQLRNFTVDAKGFEGLQTTIANVLVSGIRAATEKTLTTAAQSQRMLIEASNLHSTIMGARFNAKVQEAMLKNITSVPGYTGTDFLTKQELDAITIEVVRELNGFVGDDMRMYYTAKSERSTQFEGKPVATSNGGKHTAYPKIASVSASGVAAAPAMNIGNIDATMMMLTYLDPELQGYAEKMLQVYDGMEMSSKNLSTVSEIMNHAVHTSWGMDSSIKMVSQSFKGLVDKLKATDFTPEVERTLAFLGEKNADFNTLKGMVASYEDLLNRTALSIQARQNVLQSLKSTTDQMASVGYPYKHDGKVLQGETDEELAEEITALIVEEQKKLFKAAGESLVTDADSTTGSLNGNAKAIVIPGNSAMNQKDAAKFVGANKLIAYSDDTASSTFKYASANPGITNVGTYSADDIVAVSFNGITRKNGKANFIKGSNEARKALNSGATVIADKAGTAQGNRDSRHNSQTEGAFAKSLLAMKDADGNAKYHEVDVKGNPQEGTGRWKAVPKSKRAPKGKGNAPATGSKPSSNPVDILNDLVKNSDKGMASINQYLELARKIPHAGFESVQRILNTIPGVLNKPLGSLAIAKSAVDVIQIIRSELKNDATAMQYAEGLENGTLKYSAGVSLRLDSGGTMLFIKNAADVLVGVHEILHALTVPALNAVLLKQADKLGYAKQAVSNIEAAITNLEEASTEFNSQAFRAHVVSAGTEEDVAYYDAVVGVLGKLSGDTRTRLAELVAYTLSHSGMIRLAKLYKVNQNAKNPFKAFIAKVTKSLKTVLGLTKDLDNDSLYSQVLMSSGVLSYYTSKYQRVGTTDTDSVLNSEIEGSSVASEWKSKLSILKDQLGKNRVAGAIFESGSQKLTARLNSIGFGLTSEQSKLHTQITALIATGLADDSVTLHHLQNLYSHVLEHLHEGHMLRADIQDENEARFVSKFLAESLTHTSVKGQKLDADYFASFIALALVSPLLQRALGRLPKLKLSGKVAGKDTVDRALAKVGDAIYSRILGDTNNSNVVKQIQELAANLFVQAEIKEALNQERLDAYKESKLESANSFVVKLMRKGGTKMLTLAQAPNPTESVAKAYAKVGAAVLGSALIDSDTVEIGDTVRAALNKVESSLADPIRSLWFDVEGRTKSNKEVYDLIKPVRTMIDKVRQEAKNQIPQIIAGKFAEGSLTPASKQALKSTIVKTNLQVLGNEAAQILYGAVKPEIKIKKLEEAIKASYPTENAWVIEKAKQLAQFNLTGETGSMLLRNGYAISHLYSSSYSTREVTKADTKNVDKLVALYTYAGLSANDKAVAKKVLTDNKTASTFLLGYMEAINGENQLKLEANPHALGNYYSGRINTYQATSQHLIVADVKQHAKLVAKGYKFIKNYEGDSREKTDTLRAYYFTDDSLSVQFNAGIVQTTHQTANGIDLYSGYTVDGSTAGVIDDPLEVRKILRNTSKSTGSEQLIPVFDDAGDIVAFERGMDAEIQKMVYSHNELFHDIGVTSGRQYEERAAKAFNKQAAVALANMYKKDSSSARRTEYVNLNSKEARENKIIRDALNRIPDSVYDDLTDAFENGEVFIRRDMLNDALGYVSASVTDPLTGITRMSPEVAKVMRDALITVMGKGAYRYLRNGEYYVEYGVSAIKDIIVNKSMIVPAANIVGNIALLVARGVPVKLLKQVPKKVQELRIYETKTKRLLEIEAEMLALRFNPNTAKYSKLESEQRGIQSVFESLSIYPLIAAGELSNINDAGFIGESPEFADAPPKDFMERILKVTPEPVKAIGRHVIMAHDTNMYAFMQKSTVYGDFVAKAILYDHFMGYKGRDMRKRMTQEEAIAKVSQEYVNYAQSAGRTRDFLESKGLLWFYNFKLRSIKTAISIAKENPLTALVSTATLGYGLGVDTALTDNAVMIAIEGNLGYSIGTDMAQSGMFMNPYMSIMR